MPTLPCPGLPCPALWRGFREKRTWGRPLSPLAADRTALHYTTCMQLLHVCMSASLQVATPPPQPPQHAHLPKSSFTCAGTEARLLSFPKPPPSSSPQRVPVVAGQPSRLRRPFAYLHGPPPLIAASAHPPAPATFLPPRTTSPARSLGRPRL